MALAVPVLFPGFINALGLGQINLNTDIFKAILLTGPTAPNPSAATKYSDVSGMEVAGGNGYTTGGHVVTSTSWNGENLSGGNVTWTASGDGFTFQWLVVYDSTSGYLMTLYDNGSPITLNGAVGDTFSWFPADNDILQIEG